MKKLFTDAKISLLYGVLGAEFLSILDFFEITKEDIMTIEEGNGILVGNKIKNIEIEIDKETKELMVKGENVVSKYLNSEEEPERWYKTGDTGYINEKNQLFLFGKIKDKIEIGEKIYYPSTIETIFSFFEEIETAKITVKDEKLYLYVKKNQEYEGSLSENIKINKLKEKFDIFEIVEN